MAELAQTLAEDVAKQTAKDLATDVAKTAQGDIGVAELVRRSPPGKFVRYTAEQINNKLMAIAKKVPVLGDAIKMGEESIGDMATYVGRTVLGTSNKVVNLHPEEVIIPDGMGGTKTVRVTHSNVDSNGNLLKAVLDHPDTHPAFKAESAKFIENAAPLHSEALSKALNSYLQLPIEGEGLQQQEVKALMKHYQSVVQLDTDGSIMRLNKSYASGDLPETLSKRKLTGDFRMTKGKRVQDKDIIKAEIPNGDLRTFQQRVNSSLVNHILDAPETALTKAQKARLLRPYFNGTKELDKKLFTSVRERVANMKLFDTPVELDVEIPPPPEEELIKLAQEAEEEAIKEVAPDVAPEAELQPQRQPATILDGPRAGAPLKLLERAPGPETESERLIREALEKDEFAFNPAAAERKRLEAEELETRRLQAVAAERRAFPVPEAAEEPPSIRLDPDQTPPDEIPFIDLGNGPDFGSDFDIDEALTKEATDPSRIQQIKDFFSSSQFKVALATSLIGGAITTGITAAISRLRAHADKIDAPTLKQIKEIATTVAVVDKTIQQLKKNYGDLLKQYNKPSNSKVDNRTMKNELNKIKAEIAKQTKELQKDSGQLRTTVIRAADNVKQAVDDERKAAITGGLPPTKIGDRTRKGIDNGVLSMAPDTPERYAVPIKVYINNNNQSPESYFQNKKK